jgi:hypothetical protein
LATDLLVVLILVLWVVGARRVGGARRLAHLRHVAHDPLFARLCGLSRIPSDRTVVNWLKQFTQTSLRALRQLNCELLYEQIEKLKLPRLTIDLDGTVICTGAKVAWAARGFNPHHRKVPSYYPLLAHLAQTGQILRLKNRPGNVHDSKGAEAFVRELIAELRARFGRSRVLEFRMDAAFFQQDLLKLLIRQGCFYTVKVPFCKWTGVKALVAAQSRWSPITADIDGFETRLALLCQQLLQPWPNPLPHRPRPLPQLLPARHRLAQILANGVTADSQFCRHSPDPMPFDQHLVPDHVYLIHPQHPCPSGSSLVATYPESSRVQKN